MSRKSDEDGRVRVLAVSPHEQDHRVLSSIFSHTAWDMEYATCCKTAIERLNKNSVPVVLCEATLPDGSWTDILKITREMKAPSYVIVTSQQADDRLWAEVLNIGAYDVLAKPFVEPEVYRIIGLAWRHWMDKRRVQAAPASRQESRQGTGRRVLAGSHR